MVGSFAGCCARAASGHARRAAEQRDELAPRHHSITSSARASSVGGTVKAERLRGREVDDELELGRLLDRQVGGLRSTQNLVDIVTGAPEQVREVYSIGHQTSRFDIFAMAVHRRYPRGKRQGVDANQVGDYERVSTNIECVRAAFERLEGGRDILRLPYFRCGDLEADRASRCLSRPHLQHGGGRVDIEQDRQPAKTGDNLAQKFEPLAGKIGHQS